MDREQYVLSLKTAFASEFSFYLKSHNFHWNTTGPRFTQLHELFELIYSEVYGSIDQFAEQLRALQVFVPASLDKFSMLTVIDDEDQVPTEDGMLQELLTDSDTMAELFKLLFVMAEQAGDHGLSNFLADRQDAHKKHSWMLRSTLA